MNSLADMAQAGHHVHLHDPQTLYRHWEDEQWSPFALDLTRDATEWAAMTGEDRALGLWALSSLMVAEERITTRFSGLVGALAARASGDDYSRKHAIDARLQKVQAKLAWAARRQKQLSAHLENARRLTGR